MHIGTNIVLLARCKSALFNLHIKTIHLIQDMENQTKGKPGVQGTQVTITVDTGLIAVRCTAHASGTVVLQQIIQSLQ